jgi:hypothetical protein
VDGEVTAPRRARIRDRLYDLELEYEEPPVLSAIVVRLSDLERPHLDVAQVALDEGIEL